MLLCQGYPQTFKRDKCYLGSVWDVHLLLELEFPGLLSLDQAQSRRSAAQCWAFGFQAQTSEAAPPMFNDCAASDRIKAGFEANSTHVVCASSHRTSFHKHIQAHPLPLPK